MSTARNTALATALAVLAAAFAAILPASPATPSAEAAAGPATTTLRCKSDRSGFKRCKSLKYSVAKCRKVRLELLDSGGDKWVKVQLRKGKNVRWESEKLTPGDEDEGTIAGRDKFKPVVYVDTESYVSVELTIRLNVSGC